MSSGSRRSCRCSGFTFIEVFIILAMLAVVAALAAPQFSNADELARAHSLRDALRQLRTQIAVYAAQHNGITPGYPNGDTTSQPAVQAFITQLTGYTDATGVAVAKPDQQHRFGPYMRAVPENPFNLLRTVHFVPPGEFPAEPTGTHGWIYQPSTGQIAADVVGTDAAGLPYFHY